jgi:hypothetical protein
MAPLLPRYSSATTEHRGGVVSHADRRTFGERTKVSTEGSRLSAAEAAAATLIGGNVSS